MSSPKATRASRAAFAKAADALARCSEMRVRTDPRPHQVIVGYRADPCGCDPNPIAPTQIAALILGIGSFGDQRLNWLEVTADGQPDRKHGL